MSQLPKGWAEDTLGRLVAVERGSSPRPIKNFLTDSEDGVNWIKIGDAKKGQKLITATAEKITKEGATKSRFVDVGDFILSNSMSFGLPYIMGIPGYIHDGWFVFRLPKQINSDYFYYLLSSSYVSEQFNNLAVGGVVKNISGDLVKKAILPLPPFSEQQRIVEKLDEVLAQVDTIKARLDGIPAILKRFRQSVLAAAVSGKLTEEWRGNHPALDSTHEVANIIESRKAIVAKRMQVPQEHLKNEEYPIPDSWTWTSLDALSSKIVDGVHHKPEYVDEGIPFMSVKDINGGKLSFDNCKYISQVTHEEIHPRCNPCRGDLLITKSGTIGRTAIIKTDDIFDLFVSVALIKPASSLVNMEFINIALMHWVNSIDVSSRVVGTAIKNLHLRDMRVLAVPFAPLEEQKEIVRLVDQYFAFADTIEAQVKKAQARVDKLTQSILAKAFRGELVPQDPNDEPADKLLERIALARKEAEALAKAAKKAAKK
ncbi:type I restriction endonuclease subunit S [Vibrio cholerae]|nr:type I restriction endonuclease subunit S [Vibrio cholerae]